MAYLIKLPAIAADTTGGTLQQWLRQEGDAVKVGDAIAEVETDKALVEIAAEHTGRLARIVIPAGTAGVAVNSVLGVLLADGESQADADAALAAAGAAPASSSSSSNSSPLAVAPEATVPAAAITPASHIAAPVSGAPAAADTSQAGRIFASPLARRLAAQWQIDLATLAGSGPRGRIVRRDVEAAHANPATSSAAAAAGTAQAVAVPLQSPAEPGSTQAASESLLPHSGMRRAIARRLTESKRDIPHFYLTVDCRMDALLALRSQVNQGQERRLSVNDYIVRAVALALRDVPAVNVSWREEGMLQHASVDIAVAVATDGGLVTPIVRNADGKSLGAIAAEISALAGRARENRLRPDEFSGGSMTISNLGMYGVREFAAIINPPQAAILAVGAAERRPVVTEDGTLAAATLMTVTLSADHRAVDGAVGAQWLAALRALIENPIRILV